VIFLALALAAIIAAFALLVKQFATTHAATSIATSKEGTSHTKSERRGG
jgi:hypothetical protein